jgi:hypothetical protein
MFTIVNDNWQAAGFVSGRPVLWICSEFWLVARVRVGPDMVIENKKTDWQAGFATRSP